MRAFVALTGALAAGLNRLTMLVCAGLLVVSLVAQLATVVLRYGFDAGSLWLQDLALWSISGLLMLAIAFAVGLDAHVRVDLARAAMTPAGRRRLDRIGALVLLVPLFGLIAWLTLPEAVGAWRVGESSPQIGGMPGYWLVRLVPVVAALLALVQGLARLCGAPDNGGRP